MNINMNMKIFIFILIEGEINGGKLEEFT